MELSEKQLSKLKDLHRMADHWYQWCHDVFNQPDISAEQYRIMIKIADMSLVEQSNLFIVDGELTELPKNTILYRKCKKPNKPGITHWKKT